MYSNKYTYLFYNNSTCKIFSPPLTISFSSSKALDSARDLIKASALLPFQT